MCHMSQVTCILSHVTCHVLDFFFFTIWLSKSMEGLLSTSIFQEKLKIPDFVKKTIAIILVLLFTKISLWTEFCSQPSFRIQGGYPEHHRQRMNERTDILLSNIGYPVLGSSRNNRVGQPYRREGQRFPADVWNRTAPDCHWEWITDTCQIWSTRTRAFTS